MSPLAALESSALAIAVRESAWLLPAALTVHVAGLTILVGTISVLDLRLLGLARAHSVRRVAARVLPWTLAAFTLMLPSGLVMFTAHPGRFIANPVFALKMMLILAAGVNAAMFHAGVMPRSGSWDTAVMPPPAARVAGAVSLTLWLSVLVCGRMLATAGG